MIEGHNIKVTENLDDYTRAKISRLDRYLPNIRDIRVDLTRENTRRGEDIVTAQITVRHRRGAILRAEERTSGDINKAIDAAVDKMYQRIQRFKGKRIRKGRERFSASIEELDVAEEIPDAEPYADDVVEVAAEADIPIIRRKAVEMIPMNEDEAIEQMELLGHSFFVFLNANTGQTNILYKRTSGGYGILVPENT
jgi:putative sigma-54 modulation protein